MQFAATYPLAQIRRVQIYNNIKRYRETELDKILQETGGSFVFGGPIFLRDLSACCHLRGDGVVYGAPDYHVWGMAWGTDAQDYAMERLPCEADNYVECVALVVEGEPLAAPHYQPDMGGRRPRQAIGTKEGRFAYLVTQTPYTPEELRDVLAAAGWDSAVMLDGGGSVCYRDRAGNGFVCDADRVIPYYLVVHLADDVSESDTTGGQYVVTAQSGLNIRKGPGTSFDKLGGYSYGAVVAVQSVRDGWGQTDRGWVSMDHLRPVEAAEGGLVTDTGLRIIQDFLPSGADNRPGGSNPDTYITIHETGNFARGADAAAHAAYLRGSSARDAPVSWHYTVDDHSIYQHLPDNERAYHAGDGGSGPGNATSIGIEICVDAGGDFEQARANAAALVRLLMERHDIPLERVVQHNRWNGKDCPKTIRATAGAWEAFLALCGGQGSQDTDPELEAAVDALAAAGIIDSPERWKALDFTANSVRMLLIKMGRYVTQ